MIKDDPSLLALMMDDELRQPAIYRPGPYWRVYQRRVMRAIARHGIADFRSRPAVAKGFADVVRKDPRDAWIEQDAIRRQLKTLLARLPLISGMLDDAATILRSHLAQLERWRDGYYRAQFGDLVRSAVARGAMRDTTVGACEELVHIDGQAYSRLYVDFLARIHNFGLHTDFSRMRTALEIGGGFGAWLHLMHQLYPNIRKFVYLDIPPMIYIGTEYLRHFYGDAVRDYRALRSQERLGFRNDDALEILCICPWQIEQFDTSIDLLWNTGSFSEMTPEIVANYSRNVQRVLRPDTGVACLMMNKRTPHASLRISMPDEVLDAFQGLSFERFAPEIEHEFHGTYAIGRPTRRS